MNELDKAIHIIKQTHPGIKSIYVFGSTGTSYQNSQSDLDLAILASTHLDSIQRWQLKEKIAQAIGKDVDLIDLNDASTVLRFQIIGSGKRIFCNDPYYSDLFETTVYSAYVRFNDERRELLDDIKKRGQISHG